jgi:hypothetical protein
MSNFDIKSGNILLAGRAGASRSLVESRKDDVSPRFGFALVLDPKTVLRAGGAIFYSPENDGREDFLSQNTPFANQASYTNWVYNGPAAAPPGSPWQYQLDTGEPRSTAINIPASGIIVPSLVVNGNLETTYAVNPKIKTGTTGSYNLSAQRQLTRSISLDAAWVGSISKHLSYAVGDINANPIDSTNNFDNRLTAGLGKIQYLSDGGFSNFNSLQVKVTKQTSRNTAFLASYTWSHSLDNGPAPFNLGHINNDNPQNPYNLKPEYASSDSDLRQNFVFSGSYNLPFGTGRAVGSSWGPVASAILGGWRFSPIATAHTGTPINVIRGTNPASILPGLRPNVTGNPNLPRKERTIYHYFNTAAFNVNGLTPTASQSNNFTPGNAGRNLVIGPGWINLDSSLAKDFKVENRYMLQVRVEAFNTFNTVHLAGPDADYAYALFGQITSVVGSSNRVAQLAAKFIF